MKTNILGVEFDNNTIQQSADIAFDAVLNNKQCIIYTPNPEIVMAATEDLEFLKILNSADIVTPDGIGIVYASKILKGNINQRAAGFDIVKEILKRLSTSNKSVYIFGGKPGVAETAKENIINEYNGINVVGTHDGYFDDDLEIICDINEKSPDLLLVCLGAPKQEKWIHENKEKLNAKIMIGAGGSVDVFAGTAKRAPDIFIKFGLEWFYRLLCQPSRIGRMMKLPQFLIKVILNKTVIGEDESER